MFLSDYFFEDRNGIKLLRLKSDLECEFAVKKLLYANTDDRTALFLSGGSTPRKLYEKFADEGKLLAGSVGMVDERYGEKWHNTSNEKMIRDTGFLSYLEDKKISFYPILNNEEIEREAENYDETLRYLFSYIPKSVAILGIGADGHTAGVPAIPQIARKISEDPSSLMAHYFDRNKYGQRITMTFLALSRMDLLLVLVLGTEKRDALKKMFIEGSLEEIPARFYLKPEIAKKTILITDQKI